MFNKAQTAIAATAAAFALALPATEPAEAARPETPDECVTDGAAGSAYRVGINCRVVDVDGYPREYIVYVPSRAPVTGRARPSSLCSTAAPAAGSSSCEFPAGASRPTPPDWSPSSRPGCATACSSPAG
jgi:hypothetical protein